MAILSKKLNLTDGMWQEIGAIAFIGQLPKRKSVLQIVNANALPVGDIPEAMHRIQTSELLTPAPASGSWYCRIRSETEIVFRFTEV